ncbi:MAG: ATP synthase subunit I [Actinomycetota bacterium]|nr:ATP synthase subunit I [Actinomycetota bacterium]
MDEIPSVERDIAFDLARRGLYIAPIVILVAGLIRGVDGAVSAALALAIVLGNFLIAALSMNWAAKSGSAGLIGGVAMGGVVVRLGIILGAMLLLKDASFIDFPTFAITLLGAHMGLLTWEARYVSMSLGAPGLRPSPPVPHGEP